jgi:hypothetical protein
VAGACVSADALQGTWQLALPLPAGDGVVATVAITGTDAAGNVSAPLLRDVTIDNVAPTLMVTTLVTQTTPTGSGVPLAIVEGTSADGGGMAEIYARLEGPEGVFWTAVQRSADRWRYTPELREPGEYRVTFQAYDRAGNAASYGPFTFAVQEGAYEIFLPAVVSSQPGVTTPSAVETGRSSRAVPRPRLQRGGEVKTSPPLDSERLPSDMEDRPEHRSSAAHGERSGPHDGRVGRLLYGQHHLPVGATISMAAEIPFHGASGSATSTRPWPCAASQRDPCSPTAIRPA